MSAEQSIRRFSTQTVPQGMRFDYWLSLMRQSLLPVSEWSDVSDDFSVELQEAPLGCLSSVLEHIRGADHSRRTRSDVDDSAESCYFLFCCSLPWTAEHNGYNERVLPGDVYLMASQGEHKACVTSGIHSLILKLPEHWLRSWLPDPDLLVGRTISKDSRWGRVLSPMVSQLTPELAAAPPLPHGVLVDQLGATLALVAGDADARAVPSVAVHGGCHTRKLWKPR